MILWIRTILFFLLIHPFLCLSACHAEEYHTVKRVIDGDTLQLDNNERLRLIGVDTPEVHESGKLYRDAYRSHRDIETIQFLGKKSSAFTKKMALGKRVLLKYDKTNNPIKHRDKYGRLLVYAFLEDGTFLNAEIIRQGYGNVYTNLYFSHLDEFRQYEKEAREHKRGLWADASMPQASPETQIQGSPPVSGTSQNIVYVTTTSGRYHRDWCRYLKQSAIPMSLEEAKAKGYSPCSVCKPPL